MKKEMTLLILAGGMGSRFGGLKQIEPLGPNGEFIIDYSIYDAIKAGFTKVVFLIKEENYQIFKDTIGKRVEPHIPTEYCFQKNDNIPVKVPKTREKPFGTAHAILCCKDKINEDFAIINADDFYGRDALKKATQFLMTEKTSNKEQYGLVSYLVKNTITEHGSVKRGICFAKENKLTSIVESSIEKTDDKFFAKPLSGEEGFYIEGSDLVSMNMILFRPSIFGLLEEKMKEFFESNQDNLETCEFLIPDVLADAIHSGFAEVEVIPTDAVWHGVTHKEDAPMVRESIKALVDSGEYSNNLWEK